MKSAPRDTVLRRPLIGLVFFFLCGIACGLWSDLATLWLFPAAFLMALAASRTRRPLAGSLCAGSALFLVGWIHAAQTARRPSPREVAALLARDREQIELIGRVAEDPVVLSARREGEVIRRFTVRVEGLRRQEEWQRASGTVAVRWRTPAPTLEPRYGDRWLWTGLVTRQPRWTGGRGGQVCSLRPDPVGGRFLSGGHGSPLVAGCVAGRRACFDLLGRGIEKAPEVSALLRTLLLGYRQELSPHLIRAFSTTGTLHIIAISGLHVGIMATLLIAVLKAMGRSRTTWVLYLGPALLLYTLVTGSSPSTARATTMAIAFWAGPLFGRRPDGPSALALAALFILALDPLQLADLGFIFSFSAVAGLMMWFPVWIRPFQRALEPDPWEPGPESRGRRWIRRVCLGVVTVFVTTLSVWVTTAPLTARFFNLVAPMALPGNLLVIPMAFVVLMTGVLTLAFGSLSGWLAEVFNHANRVFISFMLAGIDWLSRFRWGFAYIPTPPGWFVAGWYVWLGGLRVARQKGRWRVALAGLALLAVGLALRVRDERVWVDVLDVGQGQAAYVRLPGPGGVLVDTGPRFSARDVIRYLRRQGVNRLRAVVLSHGDAEHVGAVLAITDEIPVDEIWCAPQMDRSTAYRGLLRALQRKGIALRPLARGDRGVLAGGVEWEILHPARGQSARRANETSLVLRVGRGATAVLFMGGADGSVEADLLGQPMDAGASVLIAGDHGAAGTCSEPWLDAVQPAAVVISVGEGNARGDPDRDVLARLAERSIPLWRTDEQGTARIIWGAAGPVFRAGINP